MTSAHAVNLKDVLHMCTCVCERFSFQTYLSLRQAEADSQFGFPPDGDVSVEMKLFLQLQSLMVCINYSVLLLRSCFTCKVDKSTHYKFSVFPFVSFFSHFKSLCICFCEQVVKLEDSHSGDRHARTGLSAHGIFISLLFKSTSILLQKRKLGCFILRLQLSYSEFQRGSDHIFHSDKSKSIKKCTNCCVLMTQSVVKCLYLTLRAWYVSTQLIVLKEIRLIANT